jgi:hypothetical protein
LGTGSFDFAPYDMQVALDATPIGVFQYFSVSKAYDRIPNVRCEQIQYKEGPEPPTARFSYILDDVAAANTGWPTQFEQVWPLNPTPGYTAYTVTPDMQIVVLALMQDQTTRVLFHGFARVPQTDIAPGAQHVTFTAVGVAVRCYDTPIGGRRQRSGVLPESNSVYIDTGLPTRFNPAGTSTRSIGGILPNCTPADKDEIDSPAGGYPIFLDSSLDRNPDPRTLWDLSKVARYVLAVHNIDEDPAGNLWVDNPDFGVLDSLLQNRQPNNGQDFFDPSDPSTYTTEPNLIRDFDATNKPWPEVLGQLLGFYGFGMRFVCEDDGKGFPYNYLELYRKDPAGPTGAKDIFLPPTRSGITDALVNLSAFHAGFDFHGVANEIVVEMHVARDEIGLTLAPGFQPTAGDGAAAARTQFAKPNIETPDATADQRLKYRAFIADECADGHWSLAANSWVANTPFDFGAIMPPDEETGKDGYVKRYRPGKGTLFSKDLNNKPRPAQLAISTDFAGGNPPALSSRADGATWQEVSSGCWDLMKDRLGVIFTCDEPWQCKIGKPPVGNAPNGNPWPYPDGVVDLITGMSDPAANPGTKKYYLRLTTVIEEDTGFARAGARKASPLPHTVQRRIDASDHFFSDTVDLTSPFDDPANPDANSKKDGKAAHAHAVQLRTAHEFPPLTASLTIPYLTNYLQIGDRVGNINGRDVSLLVNAGAEQGEPASYPFIVGVTWDFQGENQSTTIQLNDRRAEPRRPVA